MLTGVVRYEVVAIIEHDNILTGGDFGIEALVPHETAAAL